MNSNLKDLLGTQKSIIQFVVFKYPSTLGRWREESEIFTYHDSIALEIHKVLHLGSQFTQEDNTILALHFDVVVLEALQMKERNHQIHNSQYIRRT